MKTDSKLTNPLNKSVNSVDKSLEEALHHIDKLKEDMNHLCNDIDLLYNTRNANLINDINANSNNKSKLSLVNGSKLTKSLLNIIESNYEYELNQSINKNKNKCNSIVSDNSISTYDKSGLLLSRDNNFSLDEYVNMNATLNNLIESTQTPEIITTTTTTTTKNSINDDNDDNGTTYQDNYSQTSLLESSPLHYARRNINIDESTNKLSTTCSSSCSSASSSSSNDNASNSKLNNNATSNETITTTTTTTTQTKYKFFLNGNANLHKKKSINYCNLSKKLLIKKKSPLHR
jgi:uncharacterized protein YoxC